MPSSSSKSKRRPSAGGGGTQAQQALPPSSPAAFSQHPAILHGLLPPNAHICSVLEIDNRHADFSATLWMPEAVMVSASLLASQLVSVSVRLSCTLPTPQVDSLARLCSRHFGVVVDDQMKDELGIYCVIACAWPCRKLKDGVRLSKQLAHALGWPQLGTQICVSAITGSGLEHIRGLNASSRASVKVIFEECQELDLRWCPLDMGTSFDDNIESVIAEKGTPERQHLLSKFTGDSFSSPAGNQVKSQPEKLQTWADEASLPPLGCDPGQHSFKEAGKDPRKDVCWWSKTQSALSSIFGNENDRATLLLERFASRLLDGRYLLKGNFVVIPVCGQMCIFQVVSAKAFSQEDPTGSSQRALNDSKPDMICSSAPRILYSGSKTQIKLGSQVGHSATFKQAPMAADVTLQKKIEELKENAVTNLERLSYSALGGLSEQISTLKETIKLSLLRPELLMRLGLQPPHGVLLHGPPGTGKTSLALTSAVEAGVKVFLINGPEIISEYYGESEAALRAIFIAAQKAAPSVVFIDELDAIAPRRKVGSEELGQRLVATLLTLMDGGGQHLLRVLVIAATNRVEAIDPALRRPGRFDQEIEIGVPSPSGRCEILLGLLKRMSHTLTRVEIETLAAATHGFVGADLTALCNEAAMIALRRHVRTTIKTQGSHISAQGLPYQSQTQPVSSQLSDVICQLEGLELAVSSAEGTTGKHGHFEVTDKAYLRITMDDFEEAKTRVRPSAMREVMLEVPKVRWSDIGGQEEVKQHLQEAVEWPQKHSDAFSRIGAHPPRGVLLYGPPGCSKTLMARAVATEAGLNFIAVKGPELFSKWVGESEKAVHLLFERARAAAPSVVFFDELDGLAVTRDTTSDGVSVGDRVLSQLLVEMDGLNPRRGVTVIAATNRPDKIDSALLRPGRFDRLLYVGPPNEAARRQIFAIHTKKMPCGVDVDTGDLARRTDGYTGADIASICRESAIAALEENLNAQEVRRCHFDVAMSAVQPSASRISQSFYAQFSRGMRRTGFDC